MTSEDRWSLAWLALVVLATAVPFLHRPYFIDDYYHVTMAQGIMAHPLRPYDFIADDAGHGNVGWERGQAPRMVNPPGFHFFLAGVMALGGDTVERMRLASLIFSFLSVGCMYFLGKRFTKRPFAAALLMALTPAFWLTGYSLLIDGAMTALFLASLLAFMNGLDRRRISLIVLSGVLMALTFWTKYTGALVVLLCLWWQCSEARRRAWLPGYVAYPVAGLLVLLWGLWTAAMYGQMHFLATFGRGFHSPSIAGIGASFFILGAGYARALRATRPRFEKLSWALWGLAAIFFLAGLYHSTSFGEWLVHNYVDKWIVVYSFMGGSLVFLLWSFPILTHVSPKGFIGLVAGLAGIFTLACSNFGGFSVEQGFLLCLFIGGSAAFFFVLIEQKALWRDNDRRFLLVWILLGVFELLTVMPWTAARYFLPILAPMAWLFADLVAEWGLWTRRLVWISTGLMGLALALADNAQASAVLHLRSVLASRGSEWKSLAPKPQHHWYYFGDAFDGQQPYLNPLGWENIFPGDPLEPGDLVMKPRYRQSAWWRMPESVPMRIVLSYEARSWLPLRVMDVPASAGFYASVWGALPFVVTKDPLERIEIYQVQSMKGKD